MKKLLLFIVILLISSCNSNLSNKNSFLLISDLLAGEYVKESGKKLIDQPNGFTKIIADSSQIDDILIVAVHGYESEGYEWVLALNNLSEKYSSTYFYRYDWEMCPDVLGKGLSDSLSILIENNCIINNLKIFGHNFGGLVVTYLASKLDMKIPVEIHTIAAPLAGYLRIMDKCDLQYNDSNNLDYPSWGTNVSHTQWRTQKDQDGAFRDLYFDPQNVNFDDGKIILLPKTMNGKRLGHNLSITWVINNYLND